MVKSDALNKVIILALVLFAAQLMTDLAFAESDWPQVRNGETLEIKGFAKLPESLKQMNFQQDCGSGIPLDECYVITADYYGTAENVRLAVVTFSDITGVQSYVFAQYKERMRQLHFVDRDEKNRFFAIDTLGSTKINPTTATLTTYFIYNDECVDGDPKSYTYQLGVDLAFALARIETTFCDGSPMKMIWEAK